MTILNITYSVENTDFFLFLTSRTIWFYLFFSRLRMKMWFDLKRSPPLSNFLWPLQLAGSTRYEFLKRRILETVLIFPLLGTQMPLKENPIGKIFNLLHNKLLIHHLLNIHWIFLVNLPKGIFSKPLLVIIEQIWIITIYIDNMILSQFSYLWFQFMVTTHVIAPWDVPYNSVFPTRLPFTDERKTFLN